MKRCKCDEADVIIDGKPYKLESLQEARVMKGRADRHFKGIYMPHPQAVVNRFMKPQKGQE